MLVNHDISAILCSFPPMNDFILTKFSKNGRSRSRNRLGISQSKNTDVSLWARADYLNFQPQRMCDRKTIGSHLNFTTAEVVYLSLQFKYMIFHIFICILHLLWVCYELTMWPVPRWLDSSVGRALNRYCRGHGFESPSGLNFFRL